MKRVLALTLTALLVLAAISILVKPRDTTLSGSPAATTQPPVASMAGSIAAEIAKALKTNIYINGHLVAREDPPTKNFYLTVASLLALQSVGGFKDINLNDQNFYPYFHNSYTSSIAFGDGVIEDPADAYRLGNMKGVATDCAKVVTYDDYNKLFNVTLTCYTQYTGNITEVGLLINNMLFFYTHLDSPVHVEGNTTIVYNLVIPIKVGEIYIPGFAGLLAYAVTGKVKEVLTALKVPYAYRFEGFYSDTIKGLILISDQANYDAGVNERNKPHQCLNPHYRVLQRTVFIDVDLCDGGAGQYQTLVMYERIHYSAYYVYWHTIAMIKIPIQPIDYSGPNDVVFATLVVRW